MPSALKVLALALVLSTAIAVQFESPALAQTTVPAELAVPDAADVVLDQSTSALVVIDMLQSNCAPNPRCVATLPALAAGLTSARAAQALVVYTVHQAPDNEILPPVAPSSNDPIVVAIPGDKFFDSDLESVLRQAGITQVVLTGVASNRGILYTAAAAIQRGYTVVVAEDGISGTTDLATTVTLWQVLQGPGENPKNVPLQANSVTLSRTDRITYK